MVSLNITEYPLSAKWYLSTFLNIPTVLMVSLNVLNILHSTEYLAAKTFPTVI